MVNVMLDLISRERPVISSIIDCKCVSYRDLSLLDVRYVQDGKYYCARSYCTSVWLAKSPLGPVIKEDGTLQMDCIRDVAEVEEFSSILKLRRRMLPETKELVQVKKKLDSGAKDMVLQRYPFLKDVLYKTTFYFAPTPTIHLCLAVGEVRKKLLGTVAIGVDGNVIVTSKVTSEVDDYVAMMQGSGYLLISKEIDYE